MPVFANSSGSQEEKNQHCPAGSGSVTAALKSPEEEEEEQEQEQGRETAIFSAGRRKKQKGCPEGLGAWREKGVCWKKQAQW